MGIGTGTGCCGCEGDYCANIGPDPENAQWKVTLFFNDSTEPIERCAGHWNGEHILSFLTTQLLVCGGVLRTAYVYQSDKEPSPEYPECNRQLLLRIVHNLCVQDNVKLCRIQGIISDCGGQQRNANFIMLRDGDTWRKALAGTSEPAGILGGASSTHCGGIGTDTITLERIDP